MGVEVLKTISKDDLLQWEMLNDFLDERANDIKDCYVEKPNNDCVEEINISDDKKTISIHCALWNMGHLIDYYDIDIPVSIFIAEDWKEKVTKFWELKNQIAELEK